jgi:hypothetical protein
MCAWDDEVMGWVGVEFCGLGKDEMSALDLGSSWAVCRREKGWPAEKVRRMGWTMTTKRRLVR